MCMWTANVEEKRINNSPFFIQNFIKIKNKGPKSIQESKIWLSISIHFSLRHHH